MLIFDDFLHYAFQYSQNTGFDTILTTIDTILTPVLLMFALVNYLRIVQCIKLNNQTN